MRVLPFRPHSRRIASNPAQYVRRPPVHPPERRGLDRGELARFLYTAERFDTMVAGRTLDARWASWHTHAGHLETICSSVVKGCDLRISRGGGVWLLMAATGLDGGRWTANRGARRRWWYDDDPESG
jgi:hypothetical protein